MGDFFWFIGLLTIYGMTEVIWFMLQHVLIVILLVVGLIVGLLIYWVSRAAARNGGFWLGMSGSARLRWHKCPKCEGCGVTMMDGTPIPKKYRTFGNDEHGGYIQGTIANTKSCDICRGMAGGWYDSEGSRQKDVIDR